MQSFYGCWSRLAGFERSRRRGGLIGWVPERGDAPPRRGRQAPDTGTDFSEPSGLETVLDAPRHQLGVRRLAVGEPELAAEGARPTCARRGRAPRRPAAARTLGRSGRGRDAAARGHAGAAPRRVCWSPARSCHVAPGLLASRPTPRPLWPGLLRLRPRPAQALRYPPLPHSASWLNRIEAQAFLIRRYIAWRNRHAQDRMLREVVKRANVPDAALACSRTCGPSATCVAILGRPGVQGPALIGTGCVRR